MRFTAYLAGRCANGAQRDAGTKIHLVDAPDDPRWWAALCGAKGGRLSNGFEITDRPPTCPRCLKRAKVAA